MPLSKIVVPPLTQSRKVRLAVAAVGAALLCTVLATRVFLGFDGVRAKLVKASTTPVFSQLRPGGLINIETSFDQRVAWLEVPVAVIASIANGGKTPQTVSIHADGKPLCEAIVEPGAQKRMDCAVMGEWKRGAAHTIEVRGSSNDWTLEYLELASHHGSSTRALHLVVLPNVSNRFVHPGPVFIGLGWIAIVGLWLTPVTIRWRPLASAIHRAASIIAVLFLAALLFSPSSSSFLLIISMGSFVKIVMVLLAPQTSQLAVHAWNGAQWTLKHGRRWRPQLAAAAIALIVLLAYGLIIRATAKTLEGQYSGLLRISGQGFDRVPFLHNRSDVRQSLKLDPWEGYDAQFQYFAIYDPLLRRYSAEPWLYRDVADAPPYRFGRMGFAMLARVVAGSHWQLYPETMVALVWLGVGLVAFALSLLAQRAGASALWGLLALAVPGFWQSVQVTLPEPIAAGLLLMGYLCVLYRRILPATVLFAASLLVRETGVVLVLAIALLSKSSDLSKRSRALLLCSALPFILWRLYVAWILWPEYGWGGLVYNVHVMTVPFAGLAGLWSDLARGQHHPDVPNLVRGALWFSLLLVGVCLGAMPIARASGRVVGVALAIYAVMALSYTNLTVWSHVGNGQRASYEVFLLLAVATLSYRHYSRSVKATLATCWTAAALYLLLASHDVLLTRGALFPWT